MTWSLADPEAHSFGRRWRAVAPGHNGFMDQWWRPRNVAERRSLGVQGIKFCAAGVVCTVVALSAGWWLWAIGFGALTVLGILRVVHLLRL